MSNETPRTDTIEEYSPGYDSMRNLARTLETELAQSQARETKLEAALHTISLYSTGSIKRIAEHALRVGHDKRPTQKP